MKKSIFLAGTVALLMLSACSKHKDVNMAKNGMSDKEVVALLGDPDQKVDMPMGIQWWKYGDNSMVVIQEGKVSNVVPDIKENMKGMDKLMDKIKNDTLFNK